MATDPLPIARQLFLAILKAKNAKRKPEFPEGEVKVSWDLNNRMVSGSFKMPLTESLQTNEGKLILDVADFLIE